MKADLHSHLLPGIDDGAASLEKANEALGLLYRSGVTHLALTPHFYPSHQSLERFLTDRETAERQLFSLPISEMFSFSVGAEVYLSDALFNYDSMDALCYRGTKILLTELETVERYSATLERKILRLTEDYGVTPLLAHVERYPFLIGDARLLAHLAGLGCLFQLNITSFSRFFLRRRLFSLEKEGYTVLLGEDCHGDPLPGQEKEKLFAVIRKGSGLIERSDAFAASNIFLL